MAGNYRQLQLGTLGTSTVCPTCGPGSYRTVECSTGTIRFVSKTAGWNGSISSILQYTYVANDVVWIKNGASVPNVCAEVTGSVSDPAGPYKIDEAANSGNGPFAGPCSLPTSCVNQ